MSDRLIRDSGRLGGVTDAPGAPRSTNLNIWDIGSITALFAMSNRVAHLGSIQPNPVFFSMGR